MALPKILHKGKIKFTFSPFQGLLSCPNLLYFSPYLSQNSCAKFYTEEVCFNSIEPFFNPSYIFYFQIISFDIMWQSCYCSCSYKNQLKNIFLFLGKGKTTVGVFISGWILISGWPVPLKKQLKKLWDILDVQVQNIINDEHKWLHKKLYNCTNSRKLLPATWPE